MNALSDTAARIVAEAQLDLSGKSKPVSMMPLLQTMIAETGVAKDTAALYLTVAIRQAQQAPPPKPMLESPAKVLVSKHENPKR